MREQIEQALSQLRVMLQYHRGNIELVSVDEGSGTVSVRLLGACVGCPMSQITLKAGVEATLKELVPGVKEVVNVP